MNIRLFILSVCIVLSFQSFGQKHTLNYGAQEEQSQPIDCLSGYIPTLTEKLRRMPIYGEISNFSRTSGKPIPENSIMPQEQKPQEHWARTITACSLTSFTGGSDGKIWS